MAVKVTKTTVKDSEISSEIDLQLPSNLTTRQQNKIKDEAGELIVDIILGKVGQAKSPIRGGSWPVLSTEYKKIKKADGRGTKANLEFSGDMLDGLEFKRTKQGIKLQITGNDAPKADGHNNFSGKSKIPTRRFLPQEGDKFVGNVDSDVRSIIADQIAKSVKVRKSDLRGIETKRQLNTLLRDEFPGVSVKDAKAAILFDEDLRDIFSLLIGLF